jgi:hypothetical protein
MTASSNNFVVVAEHSYDKSSTPPKIDNGIMSQVSLK